MGDLTRAPGWIPVAPSRGCPGMRGLCGASGSASSSGCRFFLGGVGLRWRLWNGYRPRQLG